MKFNDYSDDGRRDDASEGFAFDAHGDSSDEPH